MDWASHGGCISKLPAHIQVVLGHLIICGRARAGRSSKAKRRRRSKGPQP